MSIPSYCHAQSVERFLHDNVVAEDQDHIGENWKTPAFFLAKNFKPCLMSKSNFGQHGVSSSVFKVTRIVY